MTAASRSPDALFAPEPVSNPLESGPEPKASRVRVWQAADRILRSGRRPTVEGVRELLGGGSPNSVTAYINDWYRELGARLVAAETPLAGFPSEAVSLMTELWRLATVDQAGFLDRDVADDTATRMMAAERDALEAEAKALQTLNQELKHHRATAEKALAEVRALLARREAALEDERSRTAGVEQALAQARIELEIMLERRRLGAVRTSASSTQRTSTRRRRPADRPLRAMQKKGTRRPLGQKSAASRPEKRTRRQKRSRKRRK
jgi:hypothetical protein